MTEIVMDKISISILHIEIQISLGHWMILRNMSNHMDAFYYLTGLIYQEESVIVYLWPIHSNTMQIPSFRKELTTHGIRRNNDLCFSVLLQEIS